MGGRIVGTRGVKDTLGTWPTESTKQGSHGLTEVRRWHSGRLHGSDLGPLQIRCDRLAWCSCGTPDSGNRAGSDSFACS